jgi:hypothetical protein
MSPPRPLRLWVALAALAGCAGGEWSADGGPLTYCSGGDCPDGGAGSPSAFSFVILPDTQFYAAAYEDIFEAQTAWIEAQREQRRIAFVLHEGDIVDDASDGRQWEVAARSLHALDGKVPYLLAAGNHDLEWEGGHITRRCDRLNAHFPAALLAATPGPSGTFEPDHVENRYQVVDAPGARFLVLSLEYGPRDAVVAWADVVLAQYATVPAILLTHAYLARGDQRYQRQPFHPCGDGPGEFLDCNDGEMLWDRLVSRHDNVVFVFSGHDLFPGVARLTSMQGSGKRVHQVLANYQTCGGLPCVVPGTGQQTLGGDGFLRIVTIDPARRTAGFESYSPYLDRRGRPAHRTDPDHQFTLPLDAWQFQPPPPRAALAFVPAGEAAPGKLAVRAPIERLVPPRPPSAARCDSLHVALRGVEAVGQPGSARTLRACLDGACEGFTIDGALRCVAARAAAPISCVNDEGTLRLFFVAPGPRARVTVTAADASGATVFEGDEMLAGAPCWEGVSSLRDRRRVMLPGQ